MKIAVCSRSFSKNATLRFELEEICRSHGNITLQFNDEGLSLAGQALTDFLAGAERAIIALERVDGSVLAACPALRIIGKYGVGLNNIDLAACNEADVHIGWTPGVNRQSVAEMCVALMITVQRRLFESNRNLLAGRWGQLSGPQLSSSTVGIVGYGHVGQALARLLAPFGCSILVNDLIDFSGDPVLQGVRQVSFDELIEIADIVTLHVPSTPRTRAMIDDAVLTRMKPASILVNTARGDLVVLDALKRALMEHRIAGAAVDVFSPEPPTDDVFIGLPNLVATSHLGGSSNEAILAMGRAAIEGLFNARPAAEFLAFA